VAVIVLVAPIIAVVILGFEIGPFPRLLATDVYLILITARSRCVGRPVQFANLGQQSNISRDAEDSRRNSHGRRPPKNVSV